LIRKRIEKLYFFSHIKFAKVCIREFISPKRNFFSGCHHFCIVKEQVSVLKWTYPYVSGRNKEVKIIAMTSSSKYLKSQGSPIINTNIWMNVFLIVVSNYSEAGWIFLVAGFVTKRILPTQYNEIESKKPHMKEYTWCLKLSILKWIWEV